MIGGGVAISLARSGRSPVVHDIRPDAAESLPGVAAPVSSATEVARRSEQIGAYMAERSGEFTNLMHLGPTLGAIPPEERFEFALDLFLAGLTTLAKM